jgi:two-component system response regulator CpxR
MQSDAEHDHKHGVLVVEDDRDFRDALQMILTVHGLDVFCAMDGQEALDILHRGLHPCVILLDMMMPRMSGAEFRSAQQHDSDLATIPVVLLSASANCAEAQSMGISEFMRKPVDVDELVAMVSRHCTDQPQNGIARVHA